MFHRAAVCKIDSPLFHEAGVVILTWLMVDDQPTATVLTSKGTFSTLLIAVPAVLREPISLGRYQAQYSAGYVTIWLSTTAGFERCLCWEVVQHGDASRRLWLGGRPGRRC